MVDVVVLPVVLKRLLVMMRIGHGLILDLMVRMSLVIMMMLMDLILILITEMIEDFFVVVILEDFRRGYS